MSSVTIISIVVPIFSTIIAVISLWISLYEPFKKFLLRRSMNKMDKAIYIYKILNPCDLYNNRPDGEILLLICYKQLQRAVPYGNEQLTTSDDWRNLNLFEYLFKEIYDKVSIGQLLFVTLSYWNLILKKLKRIAKILNQEEYIGKEISAPSIEHLIYGTHKKQSDWIDSRMFLLGDINPKDMLDFQEWRTDEVKTEKVDLPKIIKRKLRDNGYWNIRKQLKSDVFGIKLFFSYKDIKSSGLFNEYAIVFNKKGECSIPNDIYFWYMENNDYILCRQGSNCFPECKEFIKNNKDEILRSVNYINDFFFKKGKKLVVDETTLKISLE